MVKQDRNERRKLYEEAKRIVFKGIYKLLDENEDVNGANDRNCDSKCSSYIKK